MQVSNEKRKKKNYGSENYDMSMAVLRVTECVRVKKSKVEKRKAELRKVK